MKLLVAAGGVVCLLTTLLPLGAAQDQADPQAQKHLTVAPVNGLRPVLLSAVSIERGADYPSLVELKGNVEIRTPVCVPTNKSESKKLVYVCDGETVLRAEEAVFHEDTGEVEARGSVSVTPHHYQHRVTTGWGDPKK